jgi:hypothetical protein
MCGFTRVIFGTAAIALTLCVVPAGAHPIVKNCRVVALEGMPDDWRDVDRVEIDEERKIITFAVGRSIGTASEKAFAFENKKDAFWGDDQVVFDRFESTVRIAAIRLGSPTAIWVEPSLVRLVTAHPFGSELAEFSCDEKAVVVSR